MNTVVAPVESCVCRKPRACPGYTRNHILRQPRSRKKLFPRTGVGRQTLNHPDELTGSKKQRIASGEMSLAAVFKSRHGSSRLVSLFQRLYLAEFKIH